MTTPGLVGDPQPRHHRDPRLARTTYSDNTIGPDGSFVPAHGYRCSPDGFWTIGEFGSFDFDTPGAENVACPTVQCGGDEPRNCFEARAEPGCSDGSCCDLVAAADPACATEEWDASCVALAQSLCLSSQAAPEVTLSEARLKQAGADDDEYVEILGAPGTSLDGVSIVLLGSSVPTRRDRGGGQPPAWHPLERLLRGRGGDLHPRDARRDPRPELQRHLQQDPSLVHNFVGTVNGDTTATATGLIDLYYDTIDSVALIGGNDTNCFYSGTIAGPDGDFTPGHIYICDPRTARHRHVQRTDGTPRTISTLPPDDRTPPPGARYPRPDAVGIDLIQTYGPDCCSLWDASCDDFIARNYTFGASAPAAVEVVEVRTDQIGDDNDEYIELATAPGQSLDGFSVVVLGDGATGSGQVETRIPLIDVTADENGLVLIADASTFTLGTPTYDAVFDIENSDNLTVLVVYGFSGDELAPDLDVEDDGVLDATPWVGSTSCIALIETDPTVEGDQVYCDTRIGPDATFVPGHVFFDCDFEAGHRGFDPVGTDDTSMLNPGCGGLIREGDFNGDGIVNVDFGGPSPPGASATGAPRTERRRQAWVPTSAFLSVWGPARLR